LGLALRLDVGIGEATLELTGSIGGVAIDNPSLGTVWGYAPFWLEFGIQR
jgi:hypothetical protein